jgi:hypothetical protein
MGVELRGQLIDSVPLAGDAIKAFKGAAALIEAVGGPGVIAELELGEMAVKMLLATAPIHRHPTFEDGELMGAAAF